MLQHVEGASGREVDQKLQTSFSVPDKKLKTIEKGDNLSNSDSLDPVDATRLQGTHFLFDRYSYIDIKSPEEFSPLPSQSTVSLSDGNIVA